MFQEHGGVLEMFYSDEPAWATPDSAARWAGTSPRYAFQAPPQRRLDPCATNLAIGATAALAACGLAALLPGETRLLLLSSGLVGTGGAGLLWHAALMLRARGWPRLRRG